MAPSYLEVGASSKTGAVQSAGALYLLRDLQYLKTVLSRPLTREAVSSIEPSRPLVLNIIGPVRIEQGSVEVPLRSLKALALISYVALDTKTRFKRAELASIFWPDSDEEKAYSSLRQVIRQIRYSIPLIGNCVNFDHAIVDINRNNIETDLDRAISSIEKCISNEYSSLFFRAADLLQGLDDIGEEFCDWLRETRAILERKYLRSLVLSMQKSTVNWPVREALAEAVIAHEPLNEAAHRIMIEGAARRGDTGTALSLYGRLHDQLDAQLGMEPSAETQDLIVRVKLDELEPCPAERRVEIAVEAASRHGSPLVVVLPFAEYALEGHYASLGNYVADEIAESLFAVQDLRVIAPASIRGVKRQGKHDEDLVSIFNVDYYVSGRLHRSGDDVVLSAQLVNRRSGTIVWTGRLAISGDDIASPQRALAQIIIWNLVEKLKAFELEAAIGKNVQQLSPYQIVLKAKSYLYLLNRPSFDEANRLLDLALERDPHYAAAHLAKAEWHSLCIGQGWSEDTATSLDQLVKSARAALRLGQNARALALLGHNRVICERDFGQAQTLLTQAQNRAPGDPDVLLWTVPTLAYGGQGQEAVRNAHRALESSPNDPLIFRYFHFAGIAHFSIGNYDTAAAFAERSLSENIEYLSNVRFAATSFAAAGRMSQARQIGKRLLQADPAFTVGRYVQRQMFEDSELRSKIGTWLLQAGLPA
jgi:DNA-binding SARP family transcriptional activator